MLYPVVYTIPHGYSVSSITSGDHIPKIEYTAEEIELWLVNNTDMILFFLVHLFLAYI